ncbi:MAG: hypothetical protein HN793_04335 [Rhodospirillaceae bacterium]|jgi:hypothetical protein|nr:hypothetical protein [Rhodospirillaceae bacterium]MBT5240899.1 hypothetical protein [Rhodospirillaceae bacterium]MBT5565000.1 hypothetical protein [Rhodospirillaceae bacterium]MBT6090236.1 hypothetical protein [Rhodospirillaceae bacterium]MBT6960656.1 hypothetical protein [Rhodospirillaceae bacterium]
MAEKTEAHPRAEIGFERRRQMQVRQSLIAVLDAAPPGDSTHTALQEAAVDYMITSMTRLDVQDIAILVRLKIRIPKDHADAHQGLVDLEARQARARTETKTMADALQGYRESGRDTFAAFDTSLRHFHAEMQAMMTPRKNPYEPYTNTLFTDDDWTAIAGTTETSLATEQEQYTAVKSAAPDGMDPESFSGTHGLKPSHIPSPD